MKERIHNNLDREMEFIEYALECGCGIYGSYIFFCISSCLKLSSYGRNPISPVILILIFSLIYLLNCVWPVKEKMCLTSIYKAILISVGTIIWIGCISGDRFDRIEFNMAMCMGICYIVQTLIMDDEVDEEEIYFLSKSRILIDYVRNSLATAGLGTIIGYSVSLLAVCADIL